MPPQSLETRCAPFRSLTHTGPWASLGPCICAQQPPWHHGLFWKVSILLPRGRILLNELISKPQQSTHEVYQTSSGGGGTDRGSPCVSALPGFVLLCCHPPALPSFFISEWAPPLPPQPLPHPFQPLQRNSCSGPSLISCLISLMNNVPLPCTAAAWQEAHPGPSRLLTAHGPRQLSEGGAAPELCLGESEPFCLPRD